MNAIALPSGIVTPHPGSNSPIRLVVSTIASLITVCPNTSHSSEVSMLAGTAFEWTGSGVSSRSSI
jgi:hypothetical protein